MAETAGSVQFGLTLGPLDRALQPSTEETLERVEEDESDNEGTDGRRRRRRRWRWRWRCMVRRYRGGEVVDAS